MEIDVPLTTPVYRNIDKSMARDSAALLIDGYLDEEENVNSRPGLTTKFTIGSAPYAENDGMFWWDDVSALIMLTQGQLWYSQDPNAAPISFAINNLLSTGKKATFATDGTYVFAANGGKIVYASLGGSPTFIADVDAPAFVTHVIYHDGYLIANLVGSKRFYWADLETPLVWSALNFASAGARTDVNVAIHLFNEEIYIFGKTSVEIWQNDGVTPFSRVEGGVLNTGCIAPYSIIETKNGIMWLDSNKKFVRYTGGALEEISTPYDKDIMNYSLVSDCEASEIVVNGKTFYKFEFPSMGKTLIFNSDEKDWNQWSFYNMSAGSHERFLGRTYVFSPLWNMHLFGSRKADGKVFAMSEDVHTDDGNPIRVYRLTGKISYGTQREKSSNFFMMRAKRGQATDSSEPVMTLRIRDDGGEWSNEIQLSLGKMAEEFNIIKLENLGSYRNRQYEIVASDPVGIAYGDAKEDIYVGYS